MITGAVTLRTWGRYIPVIPAGLTVMAAGWGFQRVFTWPDVAAPVVLATLLGAGAGLMARRVLTGTSGERPAVGGRPGSEIRDRAGSGAGGPAGPAAGFNPASLTIHLLAGGAVVAAVLLSVAVTAAAFASPGASSAERPWPGE